MDFHSLTRRELQALCKKNKIPANTTNIAMADALKALEIVEGMEEFLKPAESETAQSSVESPEKMVITSPSGPRTGCKTSNRRKAIQEEPESKQILTRTRRGTRTIAGEVENAKLDMPTTPAMPSTRKGAPAASTRRKMETQLKEEAENDKNVLKITTRRRGTEASACRKMETQLKEEAENEKNVSETPAEKTTRRRGTGASARRKMETHGDQKEETSVLQVHSTRRTTRLLEKKMVELNLNDNEGVDPIQVDSSDKEMPKDLEGNVEEDSDDFGKASEVKGMYHDQHTISDDVLVQTDDLEALSDKKSDFFSENVRELDDNVQECIGDNYEIDELKVKRQQISDVFDESDIVLVSDEHTDRLTIKEDKDVDDENKDDDDSETKSGVGCENYGESDILSGENLEKSLGLKDDITEKEGCVDSGTDIENPTECLVSENGEGLKADKDLGLKGAAGIVSSGSICGDVIDPIVALQSSMLQETDHSLSDEEPVVDDLVSEDQNDMSYNPELNDVQYLESGLATEEQSDEKALCADAEIDLGAYGVQDLESTLIGEDRSKNKAVVDDAEVDFDHPEHSIGSMQLENEERPTPETVVNCGEEPDQLVIESSKEDESDSEKSATMESSVQVAIDPSVEESMMFSVNQVSSCPVISEDNVNDQLAGQESMNFVNSANSCPSSDKTPCPVIPSAEVVSTLAADPLPDLVSCPASLTPMKKSSSKTPTTSQKINNLFDHDKENIDKSDKILDLAKEKQKKDKNTVELFNDDISLRQLKKIFKEKLQITKSKNIYEEKNNAKVGRARPALQTLSENRLAATETENEN